MTAARWSPLKPPKMGMRLKISEAISRVRNQNSLSVFYEINKFTFPKNS